MAAARRGKPGRRAGGAYSPVFMNTPSDGTTGQAYAWNAVVLGGRQPFSFSRTGALPPGASFASDTSTCSITAAVLGAVGAYGGTITVTDADSKQGALGYTINVTAGAATAPAAIAGMTATPGDAQVVLAWTAPANGGSAITDYVVQYRTSVGPGAWTGFADGVVATPGATVTGLTNSTGYDFRAAAVNAIGQADWSNVPSATPVGVNQYAYTPTSDSAGWGSSSLNGGDFGSPMYFNSLDAGVTYIGPAATTPASGPLVSVNRGAGGNSGIQIANRIAAGTERELAANTFLHFMGNFGGTQPDTIPATTTGATVHAALVDTMLATYITHGRVGIGAKWADGGASAPTEAWLLPQEFNQIIQASYPAMFVDTNLALRQLPALTAADEISRDWLDRTMESYWGNDATLGDGGTNQSHMGPTGQRFLARTVIDPFFEAYDGGLPFIGHRRVRSTAGTNQTIGGLVASLPAVGTMAGTTWSLIGNANFTAVVNGQNVEIRRATGTLLLDAPYRVQLRASKGGRSRDTHLEIYLCDTTGVRQGAVRVAGHHGASKVTMPAGLRNLTSQQISIAMALQPIAGDAAVRNIFVWGYNNSTYRGLRLFLGNNNQLSLYLYNAAGTLVGRLESGAATAKKLSVVNGKRTVFMTVDFVAGTWQLYLDGDGTGHTAPTAPVVGETFTYAPDIGTGYFHQFWGGNTAARDAVTDYELLAIWNTAIDWSVQANRDRVFNASKQTLLQTTVGSDAPWTIGGQKALLAMQGCAANFHQAVNLADDAKPSLGIIASRWATPMMTV